MDAYAWAMLIPYLMFIVPPWWALILLVPLYIFGGLFIVAYISEKIDEIFR